MNIYIISNNIYFKKGIISLTLPKEWNIIPVELEGLDLDNLSLDDVIILHIEAQNKSYAKEIALISKLSKILVILDVSRNIIINQADEVLKAKASLVEIKNAIKRVVKKKKIIKQTESSLNAIEHTILKESLKGKSISFIASVMNLSPKRVYAYRNRACKKLGGKKINDLLLISENLFDDVGFSHQQVLKPERLKPHQ
ncbi:LuxR C-terminal-related transcriptional regulator [Kosakonia sp. BK9b]|uniref:helix-turn-helix transcriptional regulator n=1 Tax=Kosakonia sp. TaxID=1916651 RepID=UPI00289D83A4|nr:LuxR C-terminal-related transcriptional regulator [Kosakonia sp.]